MSCCDDENNTSDEIEATGCSGDECSDSTSNAPCGSNSSSEINTGPLPEEDCESCPTPALRKHVITRRRCGHDYACGCSENVGVGQTPYYGRVPMCPEDNKQTVVVHRTSLVLRNSRAFRMPQCNSTVVVEFDAVDDIALGVWLWASSVGALEVVGFNADTRELELENICPTSDCASDQAAPETTIPACTPFVVSRPDCCGGAGGGAEFPYLTSGFVAPDNGDCIDIAVTTVAGLAIGGSVSIKGGTYRLGNILNPNLITICNDGEGLTPGTTVNPKDASCVAYIVPVIPINAGACNETLVVSGSVVVCSSGVTHPITGLQNGQVLVLADYTTGAAAYKTIGFPLLECTQLTAGLTLDPALPDPTSLLIQVGSTADFVVGDIITIGGVQLEIDVIDNATQMHATPLVHPGIVQNFTIGSVVCTTDCCTLLRDRVEYLEDNETSDGGRRIFAAANQVDATATTPSDISSGTPTKAGEIASITVTNDSALYQMGVHYTIDCDYVYILKGADGNVQDVGRFVEMVVDPSNVAALAVLKDLPATHIFQTVSGGTAGQNRHSFSTSFSGFFFIPVGEGRTIRARATMSFNSGNATAVTVSVLATRIALLGVAINA